MCCVGNRREGEEETEGLNYYNSKHNEKWKMGGWEILRWIKNRRREAEGERLGSTGEGIEEIKKWNVFYRLVWRIHTPFKTFTSACRLRNV